MEIIWYENKAAANSKKHRVSFEDAIPVLGDDKAITVEDTDHDEQRFVTLGMGANSILMIVVYVYPTTKYIRIISARKAHPHERREYEKGI